MKKVILVCSECGHREWGYSDRMLMNKIKMWNHVHAAHPEFAQSYERQLAQMEDDVMRQTYIVQHEELE